VSDAPPPHYSSSSDDAAAESITGEWRRPSVGLVDPDRLAAVQAVSALPIWEAATRRALDRVARLACRSMGAWQGLVTLVDADALVVVAAHGEGPFEVGERCPLPVTLCQHVVEHGEAMLVRDARADARFSRFPEVVEQGVVGYAGVPLIVDDAVVGTVVAIDRVPRDWPVDAAGTLDDLAESAVTELQLRAALRSERAFASLSEHLPDCLCRVDRDLRYGYVNPAYARTLGTEPSRVVGTPIGELPRDPATDPACRALVERAFREGEPISATERFVVDGAPRSYEVRIIPERGEDGDVGSVLWVSRDVSLEVEAAQRLRESEAQLRAMLRQAIVGIYAVQDGRFLYANPRLAELLGFDSPAELLALDDLMPLVAPEWRGRVMRLLADPARHLTGPAPRAFTALRRDGSRIEVEAHGAAADVNGRPAVVGMILDVTARNALELQLRHAQKMEAVGQLAAGVAHDFNNLLAAIVANAHLALEDLREGAANADDLHGILDAARRASELTRRLLAFGRHEPVQPVTLDLGEVMRGMEALLRRVLSDRCHLELLASGPPLPVLADRAQLEQVAMNLVVNARDAMPDGGTITLETGREAHPARGAIATLVVSDTGTGMDERTRERIFEPFFTTKARGRGTGLGLSTVHSVVEQARGTITVESAPGRGTTVRITFPLARDAATAPRPAAPAGGTDARLGGAPPIVLLAEDEEAVRRTSKRMLERAGYHVIAARHGADALRLLGEVGGGVDVLVSDISMPELDGVSLARRARARFPGLGVVLVSGYTDMLTEEVLRSLDASFLAKPFSAEQLTAAVAAMVARSGRR
jgi:two-component system cell cycle sensor histidine kinase/response regulator CckA